MYLVYLVYLVYIFSVFNEFNVTPTNSYDEAVGAGHVSVRVKAWTSVTLSVSE